MARLPVALARTRAAVREALAGIPEGATILVACSGGPDSMALADACAFVAPRAGLRCGLVTVDHRLQDGSAKRAAAVADWASDVGLAPVEVAPVDVDPRDGGPEGAARTARYAALAHARRRHSAEAVLLGHTLDDQAETVLLALARGSGPRGISGMPAERDGLLRPFLDVTRADTVRACADAGLPVWNDPHNADPRFTRSRLRLAMPTLIEALGERLPANLARTARLVAEDRRALDALAADASRAAARPAPGSTDPAASALDVAEVAALPRAIRTRLLHRWAVAAGADDAELGYTHIDALDALVAKWHGQGAVSLPGGVSVARRGPLLVTDQL